MTSSFGAERDGGQREHHGIDILAPRGAPVLSAGDGVVSSVAVTDIGGKVVWVLDPARDLSLYYAHLDSQGVSPGTRVRAGDALGTVGNTGNARTTVPHLHFGIYRPARGADRPAAVRRTSRPRRRRRRWRTPARWAPGAASRRPPSRSRRRPSIAPPASSRCRATPWSACWARRPAGIACDLPTAARGSCPRPRTRAVDVPLRHERRAIASPVRDQPTPAAATLGLPRSRPPGAGARTLQRLSPRPDRHRQDRLAGERPGVTPLHPARAEDVVVASEPLARLTARCGCRRAAGARRPPIRPPCRPRGRRPPSGASRRS